MNKIIIAAMCLILVVLICAEHHKGNGQGAEHGHKHRGSTTGAPVAADGQNREKREAAETEEANHKKSSSEKGKQEQHKKGQGEQHRHASHRLRGTTAAAAAN